MINMRTNKLLLIGFAMLLSIAGIAQDDIDNLLNEQGGPDYTTATFKSTRIINGHSIEQLKAKHLDFRISHRFGSWDQGIDNFFGIDNAITHIGLDYGVTDRLMVGLGRSTYNKTYNGFIRYKIFRQSTGTKNFPFTMSYNLTSEITSNKWTKSDVKYYFSNRMTFTHQLLIARKFNESFSLQLTPMLIHKNLVEFSEEKNDLFVLGAGGRLKLTHRAALTAEYFHAFRSSTNPNTNKDAVSIGFDVETGGHVFQLFLTTASTATESGFAFGDLNGDLLKNQIHIGFNITRTFSFR